MVLLSVATALYLRRLGRRKAIRLLLVVFVLFNLFDVMRIHHNLAREREYVPRKSGGRPGERERVYIAGMHFNNGAILKSHWNAAVLELTELFGPDNVFVSVYESGSWDDTKEVLRDLGRQLESRGVPHRVDISDVTHADEIRAAGEGGSGEEGWIETARAKRELRRIPYLAKLRNKTLQDLFDLYKKGVTFDKILFLNDVVFTTDDVITLMDTNDGAYGAACSLDFSKPPLYYDTFALRDAEGSAHIMQTWPYFKARASRSPLVNNHDAVPVTSCWNGIVVMPADPFVSPTKLRFRGIPDSLAGHHLEGSECCLIHADNPLSRTLGVFLNPRVRVGYNLPAYEATHPGAAAGTSASWVRAVDIFLGLWINRLRRWTSVVSLERWVVRKRVAAWQKEDMARHEPGVFCLINEMQVLAENGWAHV
ncbi:polysaccharide export protein [Cordyceps fumosorosea ARSEF 2679]|uniref:Polysaccharide export protein n=1 Tax=Cordyceps fumosorosea (strain ARSEF 2679) TaxID=1081104 RepID=A0A162N029_CORFA|nr:polysaccharide export protein [Cordyceps fumosorosea ARSEF 2679]OAA73349.1 polysaccharide export protein [Cordyceps fumosorosea ARSEF 2679]